MIPSKLLKTVGLLPLERYVTTYSKDYKPFSECHLQLNQQKPRTEPKAAPAFINPPQTRRETWPVFNQCFYKTTNSIYGSSSCSQPPSCSFFPASLPSFGIPAHSVSNASSWIVGSSLLDSRTQDVGVARETGFLLDEEEKGQLHYSFGGKANVLEQQEAKDEPQKKTDVLYEEGVIVLSSRGGPACSEDCIRSLCREAGLQHLLHLPVASSPIITIKDTENWNIGCLTGLGSAIGLNKSTFLQPTTGQCSCSTWEAECPNCCCKMQSFSCSSTLPLAHVQPTLYYPQPSRRLPLTEYQSSYTAEWAQPKIQQRDIHHRDPPRQQILYPSF
ncbi:uncharacterized protein LOC116669368 isoform X1 [Etheostoma spectabile]|uniref:uncharacterized protein LOC116669368 isoform X1 n=1 Tax=Etheostoma spectabile TaxID=54343 RepID=UPI0013AF1FF3|nr:uncharacterized protein LOC116669368 isoform X1 [Etheostoma spectabile]